MKMNKTGLIAMLAAVIAASALPLVAAAHGPMAESAATFSEAPNPPKEQMPGMRPEHAMPGILSMPPYLRDLDLRDGQEDRIYAMLYEQAPRQRELAKLAFRSMDELRHLAFSDRYDSASARLLAESHARALASMTLMRAELDASIRTVLTPEQRRVLDEKVARLDAGAGKPVGRM